MQNAQKPQVRPRMAPFFCWRQAKPQTANYNHKPIYFFEIEGKRKYLSALPRAPTSPPWKTKHPTHTQEQQYCSTGTRCLVPGIQVKVLPGAQPATTGEVNLIFFNCLNKEKKHLPMAATATATARGGAMCGRKTQPTRLGRYSIAQGGRGGGLISLGRHFCIRIMSKPAAFMLFFIVETL